MDLVTVGQFAWPYEPISSDDDIVLIAQEKKVHGSGTRLPFWFISVLSVNGSIYFNLQKDSFALGTLKFNVVKLSNI